VQVGRQKIPVVLTAAKNIPSKEESLLTSALYIDVFVSIIFLIQK